MKSAAKLAAALALCLPFAAQAHDVWIVPVSYTHLTLPTILLV